MIGTEVKYSPGRNRNVFDAISGTLNLIREMGGSDEFKAVLWRNGRDTEVLAGRDGDAIKYVQVRGFNKMKPAGLGTGLRRFYMAESMNRMRLGVEDAVIVLSHKPRIDFGNDLNTTLGYREKHRDAMEKASRALRFSQDSCYAPAYERVLEAYNALAKIGRPSLVIYGNRHSLSVLNGSTPVVDARSDAMYNPLSTLPQQQRRSGLTRHDVETVGEIWTALTDDNLLDYEWSIMLNKFSRNEINNHGRQSGSV